jgi:hypothetical protein
MQNIVGTKAIVLAHARRLAQLSDDQTALVNLGTPVAVPCGCYIATVKHEGLAEN